MSRLLNKISFILLIAALLAPARILSARSIDDVLAEIAGNNLELRQLAAENDAEALSRSAENTLGPTEAEFSPFFRSGVPGMASSELIVKQEFDFPTLYTSRRKLSEKRAAVDDANLALRRRDISLEARSLCLEMVSLHKSADLISRRIATTDSLLAITEKMLSLGTATALDLNGIKLDRMQLAADLAANAAEQQRVSGALTILNANKPIDLAGLDYPQMTPITHQSIEEYVNRAPELAVADATIAETRQDIALARQSALPTIGAGYRLNTDYGEPASNGVIVGLSFPLFGNSSRIKAARHRELAASLAAENARLEAAGRAEAIVSQMEAIRAQIAAYDPALMADGIALLRKSVALGRITVSEYLTAADRIYTSEQTLLDLTYRYHTLAAQLLR